MKQIYIYILLSLSLALMTACDNDHKKEIFPEEYHSVLYIKDNDTRERDFNTTQQEVVEKLMIIKAGSRPESVSSANLSILTLEDVESNWGLRKDETMLIPDDCWSMEGADGINFSETDKEKTVNVTFRPALLKTYMILAENAGKTWVLPFILNSPDATINRNSGKLLYIVDVKVPLVDICEVAEEDIEITFREKEYSFVAQVKYADYNNLAFDAVIQSSQTDVDEYNRYHDTDYAMLPESAYSYGQPSFAQGELSSIINLELSRDGLESDKTYILPLRITSISTDKIEYSDQVKYLKITNPKYSYQECDRSAWSIAFCNSEDRSSTYWAEKMLDGDLTTQWASYYKDQTAVGPDVDDFRYPVEGTYPGTIKYTFGVRQENNTIGVPYPCCDGIRKYNKLAVVVDLGDNIYLHSIGVAKKSGNDGNLDLKVLNVDVEDQFTFHTASEYTRGTAEYYAAIANYDTVDEGNDWKRILEWKDIPKGSTDTGLAPMYRLIDNKVIGTGNGKGRFLRLTFPESWRSTANPMEIAELYATQLIAVDGYPFKKGEGNGEDWNVTDIENDRFNSNN